MEDASSLLKIPQSECPDIGCVYQNTNGQNHDSNVAKLKENRGMYWLPRSAAESTDGAPLSTKFRAIRLIVEATKDSESEFDATQMEESEETRRHKTILRHMNRDEDDTRQIAHLQSRTSSGETGLSTQTSGRHARG